MRHRLSKIIIAVLMIVVNINVCSAEVCIQKGKVWHKRIKEKIRSRFLKHNRDRVKENKDTERFNKQIEEENQRIEDMKEERDKLEEQLKSLEGAGGEDET